jgi:Rrf2 family iron-sulfur cluster assembly transcriptional regulator
VKLSNKSRYAVRALFDIAFHGEGASAQIKDIAERQAIPMRFLEQIFQDLRKAGLVSGKRGPRGGYQLVPPPAKISLGDIFRALEGTLNVYPGDDERGEGDGASIAVTDAALRELAQRIEACFDALTLEELCERAQRQGVQKNAPAGYVYVI